MTINKLHYGNFINGKYQDSKSLLEIIDPSTGKSFGTCALGTAMEMGEAIEFAYETFNLGVWSKQDVQSRFKILMEIASLLRQELPSWANLEAQQTGRPVREMKIQLARLPEWFEYHASLIRTSQGLITPFKGDVVNVVERVPLGVVAQITPWNHPLLIAMKKIAPALAAGNSVIVKPSELAPLNVLRFGELCIRAGLPPGVLNIVCGYGNDAGKALSESSKIALLDITGGTETGRIVASACGRNLVPCIAELGGKAPVIVFPEANLEDAVNGALFAAFIASGQTCVCGSRILVHESIQDQFCKQILEKVARIKVGDPNDVETGMGPVISKSSLDNAERFVREAIEEGGELLFGGKRLFPETGGYYFQPTIIKNVTPKMKIFQQEVFGPVVSITIFRDEEEAINLANNSSFGLGASIWSMNIKQVHRVSKRLDVGVVWANAHHYNDPSSPWGGMKLSGMGRENGEEAYRHYTQSKSLVINYGDSPDWFGDLKARYG